jgi:lipopolysaccharide transport system ATP-binding protein
MTAAMALPSTVAEPLDASDEIAVRVQNVSKTYSLWVSPSARLQSSLLNLARRTLPASHLSTRIEARAKRLSQPFTALEPISFEIRKGESWGIIGVNGSGKSTLLKMISGNLQPTTGRIEIDGKVAILDYSSGLHGGFTGRENVYLKAATHGMSRQQVDAKFESIAAFADIGNFIDQPVKTYSSGMQARLGFAILAHVDADIIITDEALAVGDAFFVQKCMGFIRNFLKRGTFLFVSHSTTDVVSLCQNAIWLDHGRLRGIGKAKDVAEAYLSSQVVARSKRFIGFKEQSAPETEEVASQPSVVPSKNSSSLDQPRLSELADAKPPRVYKDSRLDYLNRSVWRNDIELPRFADVEGIGVGGAHIEDVRFEDEHGSPLSWMIGGEMVRLRIRVRADRDLLSPLVGFQVQDRLGQTLFADNTFLVTTESPLHVSAGQHFEAEFFFQLPLLPTSDYGLRVAVAAGREDDNAMLHCINTALTFRSVTSGARHGLVGIPMHTIKIGIAK